MARRTWLQWEREFVLANRELMSLEKIGKLLNRTKAQVVGMLVYYGHTQGKAKREEWETAFRKLHARGLDDGAIARKMNTSRGTVQRRRQVLGLAINHSAFDRQKCYRMNMRRLGEKSLAEMRWRFRRAWKHLNDGKEPPPPPR